MKRKFNIDHCFFMVIVVVSIYTKSCKKDITNTNILKQKITGQVQKGPYINGTSISMSELNSSMEQTGKIFTTQISNNKGSFEINNVNLTSSYVQFSANGYYFDEIKGIISMAPLALNALSDITDISTVNVNILTHLEKFRVEYLVKQNMSFSEAKKIAQTEILAIFGFNHNNMDPSETLDISVNSEENAILLSMSLILQGNRSVGDLTELLANIMNDIREDGILSNDGIMTDLYKSTKALDLTAIRSNLEKRYSNLGVNASIPDFEKYINDFLAFTSNFRENSTQPASNLAATTATLNGLVNARSLNTIVTFEYGTDIKYGSTVSAIQSQLTGNTFENVNADLTGLSPTTVYHYRVKAANASGTTYGLDETFTTLILPGAPVLTTNPITDITEISATCGGFITSDGGSPVIERGICWSTSSNPTTSDAITSDGNGTGGFTSSITGLSAGKLYYVRAYATNSFGKSYGNQIAFVTRITVVPCTGSETFTVNHIAGDVAPVTKTVIYSTVTNIPGEPTKCWITSNLGADHQATAVNDATEASAGWYWQFNMKQGYKHDGVTRTPNTTWNNNITGNSDWTVSNDPCSLELGIGWRIPTKTEWYNIVEAGGWANWNGPWNSGLKIHASGYLDYTSGPLDGRGIRGDYWSSTLVNDVASYSIYYVSDFFYVPAGPAKGQANTLRCLKD